MAFVYRRRMTRYRGRALLVSAAALALSVSQAQAQSLPQDFYSVNLNGGANLQGTSLGAELAKVNGTGIKAVRRDVLWNVYEDGVPIPDPTEPDGLKHPVETELYDKFVEALALEGLTWRPLFVNSPSWNRLLPGTEPVLKLTPPPPQMAPLEPGLARGAVRELFRRYGQGGTFWSDDRYAYLTDRPIRSIEAWNEPNFAKSCGYAYRFQPAPFARFVRAVADGAHDVDAGAEVVVGGLVDHDRTTKCGISVKDYLTVMAAAEPTLPSIVDAIGLHVYQDDPATLWGRVGIARAQIDATPFAGTGIDLNEFNDNPDDGDRVAADRDAVLEDVATLAAAASGSLCNIRSIAPYAWRPGNFQYDIAAHAAAYKAGITAATPGNASCPPPPPPPDTDESTEDQVDQLREDYVPEPKVEQP